MLKASRVLLAVLAALGMSSAMAQPGTLAFPELGHFGTEVAGNTTSYKYSATPTGNSDFARLMRRPFTPGGGDTTDFHALMNKKGYTPGGAAYDVAVSKPIQKAALAKAVAKTLPIVGNMVAMAELLGELFPDKNPHWDTAQSRWETTQREDYWVIFEGQPSEVRSLSPSAVCGAAFSASAFSGAPGANWIVYGQTASSAICQFKQYETNTHGNYLVSFRELPPLDKEVTETELRDALQSHPTVPPAVDDLVQHIPPAALDQLARDTAADTTNKPRAVPMSPSGSESPSGLTIPESTTTSTGTDSQGRPFERTTVTQTIARTLPSGQIQHDTQTTTTTTTRTGTNPDGSPITETTTGTDTTSTTPAPTPDESNPSTPAENQITCGLPDTPPCKIDETGTPQADPAKTQEEIDSIFGQIKTCLQDIKTCLPALPDLSWSFALPSGCSPLTFDTLVGTVIEIDMCQHQPTIHDLMSMLWAAAGLFGAVSLVARFSAGGA